MNTCMEMCISPVWGSLVTETVGDLPQMVTCTTSFGDGTALRARLASGVAPRMKLHAEVDTGWRETPVLQADMDGPDRMGRSSCSPAITTPGTTV